MDKEKENILLEIKARKELLKRLEAVSKRLSEKVEKQKKQRQEEFDSLKKWSSVEEAHEAYGWDMITEEEYWDICDFFDNGKKFVEETATKEAVAESILNRFKEKLYNEIHSFEFDLLPPSEQQRIREKNAEIMAKRASRERR